MPGFSTSQLSTDASDGNLDPRDRGQVEQLRAQVRAFAEDVARLENSLSLAMPGFEQKLLNLAEDLRKLSQVQPPPAAEHDQTSEQVGAHESRITRLETQVAATLRNLEATTQGFDGHGRKLGNLLTQLRAHWQEELRNRDRDWREMLQRREDGYLETLEKTRAEWSAMLDAHTRRPAEVKPELKAEAKKAEAKADPVRDPQPAIARGQAELRERIALLEDGFRRQLASIEQRFGAALRTDRAQARLWRALAILTLAFLLLLILRR